MQRRRKESEYINNTHFVMHIINKIELNQLAYNRKQLNWWPIHTDSNNLLMHFVRLPMSLTIELNWAETKENSHMRRKKINIKDWIIVVGKPRHLFSFCWCPLSHLYGGGPFMPYLNICISPAWWFLFNSFNFEFFSPLQYSKQEKITSLETLTREFRQCQDDCAKNDSFQLHSTKKKIHSNPWIAQRLNTQSYYLVVHIQCALTSVFVVAFSNMRLCVWSRTKDKDGEIWRWNSICIFRWYIVKMASNCFKRVRFILFWSFRCPVFSPPPSFS